MQYLLLCLAPIFVTAQQVAQVLFAPYPGYGGDLDFSDGTIDIYEVDGKPSTFQFMINFGSISQDQNFTFHIHSGMSCARHEDVGGHFFAPFGDSDMDPWTVPFLTSSTGQIVGMFEVDFGYQPELFIGHAMVIHDSRDNRVACGIVGSDVGYETAIMSKYPDYAGSLAVAGKVEVWELNSTTLAVNFRLTGLAHHATGGLHIHVGTTCASSGAHFYSTTQDPWANTTYKANANGVAEGSFSVSSGYDLSANLLHAVVVHDGDAAKTRIACGTLGGELVGTVRELIVYPGYAGNFTHLHATVHISFDPTTPGLYRFNINGSNGDPNGVAFHIHSGVSCETVADVGGHFWKPFSALDPWVSSAIAVDPNGVVKFTVPIDFGYTHEHFVGHTAVFHDSQGKAIACGIIHAPDAPRIVYAETIMTRYPGYNGSLDVAGTVQVWDLDETRQVVNFRLTGLPRNITGGLHIHEGTSCSDAGGHYWTPKSDPDPWNVSATVYYESNPHGKADGSFIVSSGYLLSSNIRHAVVVHDGNNVRLACGLLGYVTTCPTNSMEAASSACKGDDLSRHGCSVACSNSLRSLVGAFTAQSATIAAAINCLDNGPAWSNGNLPVLKARLAPDGNTARPVPSVDLCATSVSGAVAFSAVGAVSFLVLLFA